MKFVLQINGPSGPRPQVRYNCQIELGQGGATIRTVKFYHITQLYSQGSNSRLLVTIEETPTISPKGNASARSQKARPIRPTFIRARFWLTQPDLIWAASQNKSKWA